MKKTNKILSIFLALLMIISIIPMSSITASAASGSDYTSVSALATKLTQVFNGDIDIYSNSSCTTEVSMPINTSMNNSATYYVKSNTTGNNCSGKQCYIYANAVYNKLYNEWVGNGGSFAHSVNVITKGKSSLSYSDFVNAGVKCGAYLRTTNQSSGAFSGNYGHSMIILSYNSSNITYLEGNGDGNGAIRITTKTWSNFNTSQLSGKSRYVSHLVQPTESYYNSIYPSNVSVQVVFDSNASGVSGGTVWFDNNSITDTIDYVPIRTGYTLLGWSKSSTATSPTYYNGQTYTFTSSTTLYAVWKANTYSVKYNANGGSGSMSNSSHTYDVSKSLSSNAFTRTGYTFLGWSKYSTATSPTYTNGQSVKNLTSVSDAIINLYAVWQANTYTVSYNANGGSGTMSNSSHTYDVAKSLTSNAFTREGYTFLGWSTSSGATTPTYTNGQSVKNLTSTNGGTVNLYAVWQKNSTTPDVPSNPDADFTISIQEPSRTTIRYNDGIVLHAVVEGELPEGATIEWAVDNNNFEGGYTEDGMDCVIVSKNNGYTIVMVIVCDANDNVIAADAIEMRSNAGFFQKIGGFFRNLFGTTKIYEN